MSECTPEDLESWARCCESLSNPRLVEAEGYRMAARTITQLQARNLELHELITRISDNLLYNAKITADEINKILNRTPTQSLEAHDREVAARALEQLKINLECVKDELGEDHVFKAGLGCAVISIDSRLSNIREIGFDE